MMRRLLMRYRGILPLYCGVFEFSSSTSKLLFPGEAETYTTDKLTLFSFSPSSNISFFLFGISPLGSLLIEFSDSLEGFWNFRILLIRNSFLFYSQYFLSGFAESFMLCSSQFISRSELAEKSELLFSLFFSSSPSSFPSTSEEEEDKEDDFSGLLRTRGEFLLPSLS